MPMENDLSEANLKEIEALAAEKEQEWQSAAILQIKSLQKALDIKTKLYSELNSKFNQLKGDFKYNLKLLHERDNELSQMDNLQNAVKVNQSKYLSELSELHIKHDNVKAILAREQEAKKELDIHYKKSMLDQHTQFQIFRTSKCKEMEELLSDFQKTKTQLELENNQLKFQVEAQKLDLVNEMESLMKMKEKEQSEKDEKNHNRYVFLQTKNKLLSKEIEICRSKESEHQTAIQSANQRIENLQSELQKAKWEISDVSALKNSRILELEAKVKHLETSSENLEKEFSQRKMQLDKEIRRRESNLITSKQTLLDREKRFEDVICSLESKLETSKVEVSRALWDKNNLQAELNDEIKKYKTQVSQLHEKLEERVIDGSKLFVAKDAELALLKKREDLLKAENNRLKKDIEKCKEDLSKSAAREESCVRNLQQIKLDFKRKYEDAQSQAYIKSHDFADNLVKSRDNALAENERMRREMNEVKVENERITEQLNMAVEILENNQLLNEFEGKVEETNQSSRVHSQMSLAEQNNHLKMVIKQMTSDMEELRERKQQATHSNEANEGYVTSLEREVIELKTEQRRLNEQVQALQASSIRDSVMNKQLPPHTEVSSNHPKIQEHIQALSNNIGRLEAEKLDMRAQLQKLQAKFDHQLMMAQQREQESISLSTKLQQLDLEATASKHRNEQEVKRLKSEISNLSVQLAESRREADEYYRGGIHNNLRAMELGETVARLTVDNAAGTPWMTSPVQVKLVQDLQDKVSQLQKELALARHDQIIFNKASASGDNNALVILQMKLNDAVQQMKTMSSEKRMLLESSNKMRSELNKMKEKQGNDEDHLPTADVEEPTRDGNMDQMEKLQYELTKKELAFAQRSSPHDVPSSITSSTSEKESPPSDAAAPSKPPLKTSLTPRDHATPITIMMSSIDDASINDVWKVLEQESSSPSIAGSNVPSLRVPKKNLQPALKRKKKIKPKIRNYNIKDDRS